MGLPLGASGCVACAYAVYEGAGSEVVGFFWFCRVGALSRSRCWVGDGVLLSQELVRYVGRVPLV